MSAAVALALLGAVSLARARSCALRLARRTAGASWPAVPVEVVSGAASPEMAGEGFFYRNQRGDRIRHPNAYRRAWGKPIYVPSTQRVVVGEGWLEAAVEGAILGELARRRRAS